MPLLLALLLTACSTDPEPLTCAEGELLDGDVCVPAACGTGTWGDLETDSDTIYVDASAEDGGDGSKDSPFTVIQEGLDAQGEDGMVAVAAGTYVENLYMDSDHSGVHLAGRCRELVTIDGSEGSEEDFAAGSGIYLQGYSIMASWRVSGLTVTGAPSNGLYAVSGTVTLNGVTSRENEQTGLRVEYGTLEATDCLVQGNHYIGVSVGLSTATLSGVQVLDTQPDGTGLGGNGIVVFEDSSLEATDCLVQGNHDYGVFVRGSTVTLEGVQVLDTHRRDDHSYTSIGIAVVEQSMLMATDCLVQGNHDFGVSVRGSTVTLQGVKILDTATSSYLDTGRGIQIGEGSTLEASNCLVQGNHDAGVLVTDDSTATFSDVEILDTVRSTVGTMAKGLVAQLSANVQATNLTVQDTDGSGLNVLLNSMLTCAGCTLVDNSFAGAVIQAGGELVIHDSLIEGTISDINTGAGLGVFVYDRGQTQAYPLALTLENSTIRDNEMGAVYIKGAGSYELTGNHLSGGNGLEVNPGLWAHGDAVFVTAGEQVPMTWDEEEQVGLLLEDNTFSDSAGAGVFLDGASATLADNTYEGNTIDLVRQACGQADAPEGLDEEPISTTELCPDYDYLTQDLELHTYLEDTEAEN